MSAFLVSRSHIDAIIHAARTAPHCTATGHIMRLGAVAVDTHPDDAGRILWRENMLSVAHRYPDIAADADGLRETFGIDGAAINRYRYSQPAAPFDSVATLKALRCYEYQSCEHPEWPTSAARRFCDDLIEWCIEALPGYDAAPWEIDDDTPEPEPESDRDFAQRVVDRLNADHGPTPEPAPRFLGRSGHIAGYDVMILDDHLVATHDATGRHWRHDVPNYGTAISALASRPGFRTGWARTDDDEILFFYDRDDGGFGYAWNVTHESSSEWGYAPFSVE